MIAALAAKADTKPTNPKDLLGVRKAPMSAVPANVLAELGVAMLEGAAKYGRHNYRAVGVRASVYYDAALRHLFAWWEGEDIDPDSGVSHITKMLSTLVVLRDAMLNGKLEDDRPPVPAAFYPELNTRAAAILDVPRETPHHYTEKELQDGYVHTNAEPVGGRTVGDGRTLRDAWEDPSVAFNCAEYFNCSGRPGDPGCPHCGEGGNHPFNGEGLREARREEVGGRASSPAFGIGYIRFDD
jgi:hypothetical protein